MTNDLVTRLRQAAETLHGYYGDRPAIDLLREAADTLTKEKEMEIQTRSEKNGLKFYKSLNYAIRAARKDKTVWKISFNAEDGTRIRLIRHPDGDSWMYSPLLNEIAK